MFNLFSAIVLLGFQVWYIVALFVHYVWYDIVLRIFAPVFLIIFAILIFSSEFKYKKVVEYFKFLQSLNGLGFFNFFLASVLSLEFSTLRPTLSIIVASIFLALGVVFLVLGCLRPEAID